MARLIWTKNAIQDLDEIAAYIALDNPRAAKNLAKRIYSHIKQLTEHPYSGPIVPELEGLRYRQIVEGPCRIFYEVRNKTVYVLHVLRSERLLRIGNLDLAE